ncbi:hypothetical protein D9M71_555110 [compost metagenome]
MTTPMAVLTLIMPTAPAIFVVKCCPAVPMNRPYHKLAIGYAVKKIAPAAGAKQSQISLFQNLWFVTESAK